MDPRHLKVEGNVLVLQQAGSPERVALLVVQRARVLDLLLVGETFVTRDMLHVTRDVIHVTRYLVGERLPHVVIPALGPQHVAGQVRHGDLRVTRHRDR